MDIPAYLTLYVLTGAVAAVAGILLGLQRALRLAGWPETDRRRTVATSAALLMGWFLAALLMSWAGFYGGERSRIPTVQYGLLIPIIAGVVLFLRWRLLARAVEAVPQEWIVGIQLYRALGLIFLVLYLKDQLPGWFAIPAGGGDALVGLLAPVAAAAYASGRGASRGLVRAWNILGLGDLVVAVTAGFLTSPSPVQMLALDAPNRLITTFPLVLIPVFLVPLSVLLHLASLRKLRLSKTPAARLEASALAR